MCFTSLDREKARLFIDVLFACLPLLDQEILPFFYNGGGPLVSILNSSNSKFIIMYVILLETQITSGWSYCDASSLPKW